MKKLGELLIEAGLINEIQLDYALALQQGTDRRLGDILTELGYISHEILVAILSQQLHLDYCVQDDEQLKNYHSCELKLTQAQADEHQSVILGQEDNKLVLGILDPCNYESIRQLLQQLQTPVKFILITQTLFKERYQASYL